MAARLIRLKLHEYDVSAELCYAFPRQDIVVLPPEKSEKLGAPGRYEGYQSALGLVEFRVADIAQPPSGMYIDYFLVPKLGKITDHTITPYINMGR